MSRHRAIRNRAYSYDEDYDDYYDEEEEEGGDEHYQPPPRNSTSVADMVPGLGAIATQPPVAPVETYSLSSYFDVATAKGGKKKTPKKAEAAAKTAAEAASSFDDDLVSPAVAMIRAQPEASPFTDEEVIQAVRQANYDADVALAQLLTKSKGSALAQALCEGGGAVVGAVPLPSPPSGFSRVVRLGDRGDGEQEEGGSSTPFRFDTPSPDDLGRAARERRGGAADDIAGRVAAVKLSAPPPPPAQAKKASPKSTGADRQAAGGGVKSPPPTRKSLDGLEGEGGPTPLKGAGLQMLQKDPEVWEEDTLPPTSAQEQQQQQDGSEEGSSSKPTLSMVVIGHVDAGKSTLMGQVLVGVNLVSRRELEKYEREAREMGKASFFLAWLMDEDKEERAHGVTMEVGQKSIQTEHRNVVLLDAPGHQDFIPQMITGASQADVALLVVPATTGEFEAGFESSGQTKEHAFLARGLGVMQLLVAVNKLDAAEPPWEQARFETIKAQLQPFLELAGFKPDKIRYVPVSGLTGENVVRRTAGGPLDAWYSGPTLLEAIDQFAAGGKQQTENRTKPLRAFVTDVSSAGKNVVASVRMVQGVLKAGSKALVLPVGDVASIKAIEAEGRLKDTLLAGEHADLTLAGLDASRLSVGSVLCKGKQAIPVTRRFQAQITTLSGLRMPILKGTQVQLHMQSVEVPAVLTKLIATLKRGGQEVKDDKPRCILGNVLASVEVTCQRPLCVEAYSESRTLGRFVLRQKGTTVAIGMITTVLLDT